jgi:hypothetical protein
LSSAASDQPARQHIRNLEQAFASLGQDPDETMSPAVDGLKLEAKANMKLTDERVLPSLHPAAGATGP